MGDSTDFENAVPSGMMIDQPVSTSKAIIRKQLVEILPQNQNSFVYGDNDIMKFNISSNRDFLSGKESYLRMDLYTSAVADSRHRAALDVGGVHSLFKSIEVRSLASGILIQRYNDYNRYQAVYRMLNQTEAEVNQCGYIEGDSVHDRVGANNVLSNSHWRDITLMAPAIAAVTISNLGAVAVIAAAHAYVSEGDWVQFEYARSGTDHQYYQAQVVEVAVGGTIIYLSPPPPLAIIATELEGKIYKLERHGVPARCAALQGASSTSAVRVCMTPLLSFLQHDIPLFLMKGGFEISFELDAGYRAICSNNTITQSATAQSYTIANPRFMGMMVTPHPDIVQEYVTQWKQPSGLVYSIPSVKTRVVQRSQMFNDVIQVNIGVRSGRRVLTIQQPKNIALTDSTLCRASKSLSTWVRGYISKFQYKIGSHEFPNRDVICDEYSMEAYQHLCSMYGNKSMRLNPQEWSSRNEIPISDTVSRVHESTKFIMAADLSRDNGAGGGLTGSDLSIVPLDLEFERRLNFDAAWSHNDDVTGTVGGALDTTVVYYIFVEHDAYLRLSSEQVVVMN